MKSGLLMLAFALAATGCAASVGGGAANGYDMVFDHPSYVDGFVRTNLRAYLPHEYRDYASLELTGQSGYREGQRSDQWRLAGGLGHVYTLFGPRSAVGIEHTLHTGVAVGEQRTSRAIRSFLVNARLGVPVRIYPTKKTLWKADETVAMEFSVVPQIGGDLLMPFESGHLLEFSGGVFLRANVGVGVAP